MNCRFFNNRCASKGKDVDGAAIRIFDQYNHSPVYLVNCTFCGDQGYGNEGSNGGGISSIGVSWTIINCLFSYNKAIGSAIFFVTNDKTVNIIIDQTTIRNNVEGSWYPGYPAISMHTETSIIVTNSTIQ